MKIQPIAWPRDIRVIRVAGRVVVVAKKGNSHG